MVVQRLFYSRRLATDRDPQPADLTDNLGLSVEPQGANRVAAPQTRQVRSPHKLTLQ